MLLEGVVSKGCRRRYSKSLQPLQQRPYYLLSEGSEAAGQGNLQTTWLWARSAPFLIGQNQAKAWQIYKNVEAYWQVMSGN